MFLCAREGTIGQGDGEKKGKVKIIHFGWLLNSGEFGVLLMRAL